MPTQIYRYFIELAYKGTAYHGWQRQPQVISVQQIVEELLYTVFKAKIVVHPCGRTDKGVHATQFFVHADIPMRSVHPEQFVFRTNKQLPKDIRTLNIFRVYPNANAQFDAISRTYEYHFHSIPDPLISDISSFLDFAQLDLKMLDEIIAYAHNVNDFKAFCIKPNQYESTFCSILNLQRTGPDRNSLIIRITANRFLQGMMRLLVGRILDVAMGKLPLDIFKKAIINQVGFKHHTQLPAQGLRLVKVDYNWKNILLTVDQ